MLRWKTKFSDLFGSKRVHVVLCGEGSVGSQNLSAHVVLVLGMKEGCKIFLAVFLRPLRSTVRGLLGSCRAYVHECGEQYVPCPDLNSAPLPHLHLYLTMLARTANPFDIR